LIAEDRVGCINQVLLNLEAMDKRGLKVLAVILNQNNAHARSNDAMNNVEELAAYSRIPIFSYGYEQVLLPPVLLSLIVADCYLDTHQ